MGIAQPLLNYIDAVEMILVWASKKFVGGIHYFAALRHGSDGNDTVTYLARRQCTFITFKKIYSF
jgi:hypothetical protein